MFLLKSDNIPQMGTQIAFYDLKNKYILILEIFNLLSLSI